MPPLATVPVPVPAPAMAFVLPPPAADSAALSRRHRGGYAVAQRLLALPLVYSLLRIHDALLQLYAMLLRLAFLLRGQA